MATLPFPASPAEVLQGCKYFRGRGPLCAHLRPVGTERDRAGPRLLFYDQYATGMLLDFFTPTVPSLRGLPQTTTLPKGQERLGVRRTSWGTLSAAADVCDAGWWHEVLTPLGAHLRPPMSLAAQEALAPLTAVDGRLVPALPRMAWALWQDDPPRAAKRPVACAVLRHGPVDVTVTAGNASARAQWRRLVPPGGLYGVARGSAADGLFQAWHDWPCSVLCRGQDNAADEVPEERPVSLAAEAAGGRRDALRRRLGTAHHTRLLPQPFRVVLVATGKTPADGTPDVLVLVTNRLGLDAELVALAYRYRWAVALCCRWVKCVLGCRHLLSHGVNGVRLQV
jgi:hypothetical protein